MNIENLNHCRNIYTDKDHDSTKLSSKDYGKKEHRDIIQELYRHTIAVSNRHICSRPLPEQIERVCRCHPKAILLREKDLPEKEYVLLARKVMDICRAYQVPCILHTFWKTAKELECPSLHLPLPLLRECQNHPENVLESFSTIGTSVHSIEDALEAQKLGATYITAGHIYATDCKKGLPPRGLDFLRTICQSIAIPVYAIGGIKLNKSQFEEILINGAEGACIMSGINRIE